jgi:hypothetical protein
VALIHGSFEMFFSDVCYVDAKGLKMKTSKSIAAVVVLLIITFLVMGATDLNHCKDDSIAQLKARISSLEQRVEGLEKKLQTSATKRSSVTRRPSSSSRDQSLPRGWRRKEFNGVPYYLVPLDQKQIRPHQRSSSKTRQ